MKKIICLVFAFFAFANASNAQVISIIGDGVGGWNDSNDVNMTSMGGGIYSLSNYTFIGGPVKFRQDNAWTNNWGNSGFPSGTGNPNGANIPTIAGVFDVTFNLTTKAYLFTPVSQGFPDISVYGTASGNTDGVMTTTDGITYRLDNYSLNLGDLVFRQDMDNVSTWASASFPSGTASIGGTPMNVIPGTYNITFNLTTGAYTFSFPQIGIVGNGLDGWPPVPDRVMTTEDGVNYNLNMTAFSNGFVKFRQDSSWSFNWGANSFPNGNGNLNGDNIPTFAGNYVVTFNRITGAYSFSSNFPVISLNNGTSDIDMLTLDGENYFLNNYAFTAGNFKFRQGNADTFVWGASTFPSGTSETYITSSIPVPSKSFNVTFNKTTGVYAFNFVTIGIIGNATPGGWDTDTLMSTTNGINYTLNGVTLTNAFIKFRQGQSWSTNWGSNSFSFPMGTGGFGEADIPVSEGSVYNITFNMQTGEYNFNDLFKSKVRNSQCGSVLTAMNTQINANPITGAQMYRFEITNGLNVRTFETNKFNFDLTKVAGSTYGTTYSIKVSVRLMNVWRTYGVACDVTSPTLTVASVPTTSMRTSQCGTTLAAIGSPIHSNLVYGAEAYRFEITQGATVTTFESPIYYFFLTDTAIGMHGTTYSIKTAARIAGVWGNYGAACNISTPALAPTTIPSTRVANAFCGTTLASLATKIHANTVFNAQAYRFEITTGGVTTFYETPFNFKLSDAGVVVANGMTYAIRVTAKVNGVYGNYGVSCNVMTPGNASNSKISNENIIPANSNFDVILYPNPYTSSFKLNLNYSDQELVEIFVYDMLGRQIEKRQIVNSDVNNIELGNNYPTGIYNVIVTQGKEVKKIKIAKK